MLEICITISKCTRNKTLTDSEAAKYWEFPYQSNNGLNQFEFLFLVDNLVTAEYTSLGQKQNAVGSGGLFAFFASSFTILVETDINRVEKSVISYALLFRWTLLDTPNDEPNDENGVSTDSQYLLTVFFRIL